MEATSESNAGSDQPNPDALRRCGECETENLAWANFCKSCGGSIESPSECPKCSAAVEPGSKFCSDCGAKLVGARPKAAAKSPTARPSKPSKPKTAAARELDQATQEGRKAASKAPSSNIMGNVMLFVAALAIILVAIYVMNKDSKKEVSPFQGGPAPSMAGGGGPAAPPASGGAAKGSPFTGVIKIGEALKASASGKSMFLIVRPQGSPNRGPPVAVKKIDRPSFPANFSIGPGDVMMPNMPFSGPFDIYVRLDGDGNAMTKSPGDLTNAAAKSGIKPGDTNVEIVLDKKL